MPAPTAPSPLRHLRARGGAASQETTNSELFFDLVYVFAVTQLSHLLLDDLSLGGVARAAFLLVVVWWAWVYTAWMTNWFDPASPAVRGILTGAMLASLLMAASLPQALEGKGLLFAGSYVALQVGRNVAATSLLSRDHRLRDVFERLVAWSVASGALWLAGAVVVPDQRLLLWIPALALDLLAPVAGYWLPGRGRALTADYDVEGRHFAERCQTFVLIALGESIVVTGATAAGGGLGSSAALGLVVAFLETVAFWWLYFGAPAEAARNAVAESDDPGRVARDAYTYVHLAIIAGIIAAAAGDELLIAHPWEPQHGFGLALVIGGPAVFLLGADLFQWRATGRISAKRLLVAGLIVALLPLGTEIAVAAADRDHHRAAGGAGGLGAADGRGRASTRLDGLSWLRKARRSACETGQVRQTERRRQSRVRPGSAWSPNASDVWEMNVIESFGGFVFGS